MVFSMRIVLLVRFVSMWKITSQIRYCIVDDVVTPTIAFAMEPQQNLRLPYVTSVNSTVSTTCPYIKSLALSVSNTTLEFHSNKYEATSSMWHAFSSPTLVTFHNIQVCFENGSITVPKHISWAKIESTVFNCENVQCAVCLDIKGKKEKCIRNDCPNYFHILCAYLYGIDIGIVLETDDSKSGRPGNLDVRLRCHKHDTPP